MMSPWFISRRQALKLGVAGLAGAAAASVGDSALAGMAQAVEEPHWIDAHVHVWTPDTAKYPLDSGYAVADMQPASFTPEELFAHCKPVGVDRIVIIQMSFYNNDNSYMTDMIARYPGVFSGVGIVDHRAPDLAEKISVLAKQGVKGFRIHATGAEAMKWIKDPGMALLWKIAAEKNLAVCPLINPGDIRTVDTLCAKFPETKVVVDHFARIGVSGQIDRDALLELCDLAKYPNVYVKTSAFYALGKKEAPYQDLIPMIKQVVDSFGPERLMWASDCPYQVQEGHNYEASIALIRDAASDFLSASDKSWLLRGTAEKVYFA